MRDPGDPDLSPTEQAAGLGRAGAALGSADLKIERDQLETTPAIASISRQRAHLQTLVEDWARMTTGEQKVLLAHIFGAIVADHVDGKATVTCKPKGPWQPYVEAVLTLRATQQPAPDLMSTSERKTGVNRTL